MKEIIICEDDLIFAKSLKVFLKQKGFDNVIIVSSGEELIDTAVALSPALIISDITLKGELDGIEALARISRIKKIPYIFITGHSEYKSVIKSYNLKPFKIFYKPVDPEEIYASTKEFIEIV